MKIQLHDVAKAYIIYRKQHEQLRNSNELFSNHKIIDDYIDINDWRVKESANSSYLLQVLNQYITTTICSQYWLERIYPSEVTQA